MENLAAVLLKESLSVAAMCVKCCNLMCYLEAVILEVLVSTASAVATAALAPLHWYRRREQQ